MDLRPCHARYARKAQVGGIYDDSKFKWLQDAFEYLLSSLLLIVPCGQVVRKSCRSMLVGASQLELFFEHLRATECRLLVLTNTRLVVDIGLLNSWCCFYESGGHFLSRGFYNGVPLIWVDGDHSTLPHRPQTLLISVSHMISSDFRRAVL